MTRENNLYLQLYQTLNHNQSMKMYLSIINVMFDFFKMEDPELEDIQSITVDDANRFMTYLKNEVGHQNSTINKYMKGCSSFFKVLRRYDRTLLEYNPFDTEEGAARLREKDYSSGIRITDENLKILNDYFASDRSLLGTRNYIVFLILLTTGIRRAEVSRIKLGDFFKYGDKWGMKYVGKGDKPLMTMIPRKLKILLDEYVNRQCWDWTMEDQWLFPARINFGEHSDDQFISLMLQKAVEATNIDQDITTHDFRHTYVTKSIELGQPIEDVSKRVGHSSIATTKRYDHANTIFRNNPGDDFIEDLETKNAKVIHLVTQKGA